MQASKKIIFIVLIILGFSVLAQKVGYCHIFPVLKEIPLLGFLVEYNFPPIDYYEPTLQIPLKNGDFTAEIVLKYKGGYDVHLINVFTKELEKSEICLEFSILNIKGEVLYTNITNNSPLFPYFDPNKSSEYNKNNYRYQYCRFSTRYNKIPIKEKLYIKIKCSGAIEQFLKCHPNACIEIAKSFDI